MTMAKRTAGYSLLPLGRRAGGLIQGAIALLLAVLMMPTAALAATGAGTDVDPFVYQLMVFVIAIFVGYYVVWSVTPALHTPLMSVTNAISGVVVVGALLQLAAVDWTVKALAFVAVLFVSINVFGGFAVTRRMLLMFRKDQI